MSTGARGRRHALPALVALAALLVSVGGCSILPGSGGYTVSVRFAAVPSLYEKSRVKIMGADVGSVERIRVKDRKVLVDLRIDEHVPVPRDARAAIVASNPIGERGVVLHPVWRKGMPRAPSGMVIPQERTDLPIEVDDAMSVFATLSKSIDPRTLGRVVRGGADAVDGRGSDVNRALQATGTLTRDLAAQDRKIASIARNLDRLAGSLNRRDAKLTALIGDVATTGRMLKSERERLQGFLAGLETLIRQSDAVIVAYREKLPATLAGASELVMTLKANSESIGQAIAALAGLGDVLIRAWDRESNSITVRAQIDATLRTWLQPVFDSMGWGAVPCIGADLAACRVAIERGSR